jgi:hypothetical protein
MEVIFKVTSPEKKENKNLLETTVESVIFAAVNLSLCK